MMLGAVSNVTHTPPPHTLTHTHTQRYVWVALCSKMKAVLPFTSVRPSVRL